MTPRRRFWRARSTGDRGMVTAEAALVLPVLVVVAVALAWLVLVGAAQVGCLDAAREAARLTARGEPPDAVDAVVSRLAPGPAHWEAGEHGGVVTASVTTVVGPRLPLIGSVGQVELTADAVAAREPQ